MKTALYCGGSWSCRSKSIRNHIKPDARPINWVSLQQNSCAVNVGLSLTFSDSALAAAVPETSPQMFLELPSGSPGPVPWPSSLAEELRAHRHFHLTNSQQSRTFRVTFVQQTTSSHRAAPRCSAGKVRTKFKVSHCFTEKRCDRIASPSHTLR